MLSESVKVDQFRMVPFAGKLQPRQFIGSEASIAKEFNVGRAVYRDALRTPQALGIVERFSDSLAIQRMLIGLDTEEMLEAQLSLYSGSC